jgi:hypothetical protein
MRTIERVPAPALDSDLVHVFDIKEEYIVICVQGKRISL